MSEGSEEKLGMEEDEDEDVDFNPFLKEALSPEASSSLSSDNDGLGGNVGGSSASKEVDLVSNSNNVEGSRGLGNEEEQEVVMQGQIQGASGKESEGEGDVNEKVKKRKSASLSSGLCSGSKETDPMKQKNLSIGIEDVDVRNFVDLDDEDAICRRTRARYSLANFTLDELETFLQETDDEDDLQNVDDDQEYRKFLAAVLQGGENDGQVNKESENVDDEDEDNDADFEVEIEEALESDRDESTQYEERKGKYGGSRRRPETRQNKRQKTPCQDQKFLGQANRPLRPILPCLPNGCVAPPPSHDWQKLVPGSTFCYPSSSMQPGVATGFTPHQIGQLHCLIHEHAQLLVQVFSLCVLDTSRQETANAVQQLISGLIHRRNEVLSWRKVPYPDYVFRPPHIHPSVSDEHSKILCTVESSSASGLQKDGPGMMPISLSSHSSEGRSFELGQGYQCQTAVGSPWMPQIGGPLLSVLDAAPLSLLTSYMNDVYKAVQEYKQRNVESLFDSPLEREPLFPLSSILSSTDSLRGATSQGPSTSPLSLPGQQKPKKTLAAALVENTKKQSVAVAPKKIVKLAERFYPLFNSALFPHKPPPPAVANRVLFTDTEDELLAMGLMEYNTDWKAIQQRFLPCKSKHQIFVRQKNRCSSKAPENPIKAVRRMKTSPLSAEEKARIHEGLRVLKLDWMSVWKLIVPHRDPTLLPRQWRIALGTQKSYKSDEAKREKRRLYESNRRKCKAAASASWQTASEKEDYLVNNVAEGNKSGDDNMDDEDEAYVHEAFLSDWKPGSSTYTSSEYPLSGISRRELQPGSVFPPEDTCVGEVVAGNGYVQQQPTDNGYTHDFLFSNFSNHLQNASQFTHVRYSASYTMASNHFSPDLLSKPPKNQVHLRPYRARRKKDAKLVKLAPDLPPVNLPPSVRVISQSAFKTYHCVKSHSTRTLGTDAETENLVPRAGHFPSSLTSCSGNSVKNGTCEYPSTVDLDPQDSTLHLDRIASEDKDAETDLEMHPLLFQAPEDRRLPYCTVDSSTSASGTLNFLPENQLQANFSHYIKPHDAGSTVDHFYTSLRPKEKSSSSCTIDFHPLLQKSDDLYKDSVIGSDRQISVVSESFQGHFSQFRNSAITNDKTSELDLEIHLSSSSRKDKSSSNMNGSRLDMNGGNTKENQKGPFQLSRDDSPTYLMAGGASKQRHILGDSVLVSPSNNISNYMEDNIGDQSLQEIVMEHEELSDSEDEIGEHVEFECEEMADSEGEESESEQLVNIRGLPSVTVEGDNKTSGICKDQQCEPKISSCSKDVACTATKEIIGSHKLGSTSRGKDLSKPSLQLSLDTAANQSKPKQKSDGKDDGGQAGKTLSSRSNRSSKRTMHNSKAAVPKQTSQLWLRNAEADTIVKPARKPRKQACKNSSAIATSGNLGCASNTNLVDCHDNDSCLRVNDVSKNVADIPPSDGKGQENIGSDS